MILALLIIDLGAKVKKKRILKMVDDILRDGTVITVMLYRVF